MFQEWDYVSPAWLVIFMILAGGFQGTGQIGSKIQPDDCEDHSLRLSDLICREPVFGCAWAFFIQAFGLSQNLGMATLQQKICSWIGPELVIPPPFSKPIHPSSAVTDDILISHVWWGPPWGPPLSKASPGWHHHRPPPLDQVVLHLQQGGAAGGTHKPWNFGMFLECFHDWLMVSNILLFSIIYGIILPIDFHIFRGVGQPPTRWASWTDVFADLSCLSWWNMIEHDIGVRSELFSGIPRSEATGLLTLAVLGSPFQLGVYCKPSIHMGGFWTCGIYHGIYYIIHILSYIHRWYYDITIDDLPQVLFVLKINDKL